MVCISIYSLPVVYSWRWIDDDIAAQCLNTSVEINTGPFDGGAGVPPYHHLFVPVNISGSSLPPQTFEVEISQNNQEAFFQVMFPQYTNYVVVGSDGTGFASGGTSDVLQVVPSTDTDCLSEVHPLFTWNISNTDIPACGQTLIQWDASCVHGSISFFAVIPAGRSFVLLDQSDPSSGSYHWTPALTPDTTTYLVAGDDRGVSFGVQKVNIGPGDIACMTEPAHPESTIPTRSTTAVAINGEPSTSNDPVDTGSPMNKNSSADNHMGAIIGGAVGSAMTLGFVLISIALLRRRRSTTRQARLLDIDTDATELGHDPMSPIFPFADTRTSIIFPFSSRSDYSSQSVFDPSTATLLRRGSSPFGKGSIPRRTVMVLQHEDAGPEGCDEGSGVVELPPAYTNLTPRVSVTSQPRWAEDEIEMDERALPLKRSTPWSSADVYALHPSEDLRWDWLHSS
ncbi:hypothetical protein BXZ70DRAFT_1012351 [Cristinia sonorae]|uniref:Uncharacterized protein n=1 Tax=Cristinia sonorae TaxID=1940300 RepID=A0A8K0UFP4_9AGAR|nr:hypothetical protein BXZ70DRAFT_1012351 [Cristinia sonorae]